MFNWFKNIFTSKNKKKRFISDEEFNLLKKIKQDKINNILEKINKNGYDNLSDKDKEFLNKNK